MAGLSERKLTLTYGTALCLNGVLALASHLTLNKILGQLRGSAAIVNVAGRQRMLSQRIASLIAQSALGDGEVKGDLVVTIDRFERANRELIGGHPALRLPSASLDPALRAVYFEGPHPLAAEVAEYVSRARRIAAAAPNDPLFARETAALFASARSRLLEDLDTVVGIHERQSEHRIAFLNGVQTTMLGVVLATLLFEAAAIFRPMVRRIVANSTELTRLANTDPLTGALNRRSFFARGAIELSRSRRYRHPLTLLMIDIDHFKLANDTFGHDGGDAVLTALTGTLQRNLRSSDLLGRIGGEEFAVLLPETGATDAAALSNRLRAKVAALTVPTANGIATFTISIGVAAIDTAAAELKPSFERADRALYEAKSQGRNRVVVAPA